jgi:hypothetical protein
MRVVRQNKDPCIRTGFVTKDDAVTSNWKMSLSVDIFTFSLPAQFFNRSFPLYLGITEEDEVVHKTSRKISVNRQSEAEEKNECVFQRLYVGSVRMSVDETKWPREGMFIHLQLIISRLNTHQRSWQFDELPYRILVRQFRNKKNSCCSWRSNAPGKPVVARATMPYICPCGHKRDDLNSIPGREYNKLSTFRIIPSPISIKSGTGGLY